MLPVFIDFEHFSTVLFSLSCFCPSFHSCSIFPPLLCHWLHQCFPIFSIFSFISFQSIILIHVHTFFLNFPKLSTIFPEFFHVFPSSPWHPTSPGPWPWPLWRWPGLREAGDLRRHPRAPWCRAEGAERHRDQKPRWDLVSDVGVSENRLNP